MNKKNEMSFLTQEDLYEAVEKHERWLEGLPGGVKLNMSGKHLETMSIVLDDLDYADFSNAHLMGVKFAPVNLNYADLSGADLSNSWVTGWLVGANLSGADLSEANFKYADLSNANLSGAILKGTNMFGAKLTGARLDGVITDERTAFYHLQCPEEGSFIGYKKCRGNKIVKLLIPEDAKRSSATSSECRCSKAKVLSITDLDGNDFGGEAISYYDENFIYCVGETVEVDNFCEDRWRNDAEGIHFFVARQAAVGQKIK